MIRLLSELSRRKTIRVAIAYIVGAWLILQVADIVLPSFDAPGWIMPSLIIVLFAVGLPIAIVLSWIFDITPHGLEKTSDLDAGTKPDEPAPVELKPSIAIPLGSAQRRQVTVLRCTFRLTKNDDAIVDPESLMSNMPVLAEFVEQIAARFSAHVLGNSGPTFELLFGFPVAYENDAMRAIAAGFAIIRDAKSVKTANRDETVLPILSVDSDLVIIDSAAESSTAATVVGSSSMSAAWVQTLVSPGQVGVSSDTFNLLRDSVECETLGQHVNVQTGVASDVYRAVRMSPRDDFVADQGSASHATYGRESEIALIMNRWELLLDGEDQFVVLRGEPGIGKSTVVREVASKVQKDPESLVIPLYCSPFESNNAFHPIIEYMLGPGLGISDTDSEELRTASVSRLLDISGLDVDRFTPLMASLLELHTAESVEGQTTAERSESGETERKAVFQCLLDLFKSAASRKRLLLIIEDLHWADPSTLELVSMMVNEGSETGALFLFTARPTVEMEWGSRSDVTMLDLQKLSRRVTQDLVDSILGEQTLPANVVDSIVAETGGNPLFIEELTRAAAESASDGSTTGLVLPGTLQQSLSSRIDRLGSAKPLLQLCSLLGRKFDYALLKAVSQTENEQALQEELRAIVNAEFLFQKGAVPESTYRFKHILMQETAYSSLLKSTRVELHDHVARILEEQFPDRSEYRPELLAYHYGEGGNPGSAVRYWSLAAKKSLEIYALEEAIERAKAGLTQLKALPESQERDAAEIMLRSMLGKGLLATRGYADPKVAETFGRALELSESIGNAPQLFQLVVGLWMYFFIAGEAEHGPPLARRLVRIADGESSPEKSLQAHYCYGYSLYRLGEYQEAREELELAMKSESDDGDFSSESASGDDTRIHVRVVLAHVLWQQGQDEEAVDMARRGLELAEEIGNPFGLVFASFMNSWLYMHMRDHDAAGVSAQKTIEVAESNGFRFWQPLGHFMQAWSSTDNDDRDSILAGAEKMEQMLKVFVDNGAAMGETSLSLQLAEEFLRAADTERASYWLEYSRKRRKEMGERFLEVDTMRIAAKLALQQGNREEAEELLAAAETSARSAGSISLARRAATDLAVLRVANTAAGAAANDGVETHDTAS
jgi:class 3 adenylate cyclase/tetratricopeptide (TPR) repeat protein